ncbi:putative syringomycin synthetase, partial [Mycobacterium sp. MAC_080597_8934]
MGGPHGGFGGAVDVDHHPVRRPPIHQLGRARLGADHQRHRVQPVRRQGRDRRRGLRQHGDALVDQQRVQLVGSLGHRVGHHHQAAAVQQRTPDLPHREIESVGMELGPHLLRRQLDADAQVVEQLRNVMVSHRNTFRHAGGARGVDEVGQVVRGRRRRCRAGLAGQRRIVDVDDRQLEPVQRAGQRRGADRGDRGGVGQHELDAGRRQCRVDRQVRRTGFQHRQNRHDRLSRARKHQGHKLARAGATIDQRVRQPVGRQVELAVRHRPAPARQRHRVRCAGHLRREQVHHRHRCQRLGQRGAAAEQIESVAPALVEQLQRPQRPGGIGGHRRQHPLQPVGQLGSAQPRPRCPATRRAEEQLVAVAGEDQPEPVGLAGVGVRRRRGDAAERQGECRRDEVDAHPFGRPGQAADLALQRVHRESLVLDRLVDAGLDVPAEGGDRALRRQAQHQRHHPGDHPGQRLELRAHPPADREVEHDAGAVAVPGPHQQGAGRGDDRGLRDAPDLRQPAHPAHDVGVQRHRRRRPRVTLRRGGRQPGGFGRKVRQPVGLVVAVVGRGFVVRLALDQLPQRAEDGRRDGSGGDDRGVDGGDAVTDQP